MQVQTVNHGFVPQFRNLPANQPAAQTEQAPQDQVSIQSNDGGGGGNHFGGGKLLVRMAGGAVNGLVCNYLSGGSVGRAALIGGGVGLAVGGAVGAVGGAIAGQVADAPAAGAIAGGVLGGGIGAVSGAAKGAITIALTNAFGGGPLAAAGVGAALSLVI